MTTLDYINKITCGDCFELLKNLDSESVDCCITSPPYWGLRDYGVEGQLGLEKTPEEYVAKLVAVFQEVKRVLKKEGTLWLNLGDTYSAWKDCKSVPDSLRVKCNRGEANEIDKGMSCSRNSRVLKSVGLKNKDIVGIPWRVAFALQADGWWLRQDIIWAKPNPMPESVTDRCTKSHEYVFLLAKSQKYYYNGDAIKEPLKEESIKRNQSGCNGNENRGYVNGPQNHMSKYLGSEKARQETNRNKRSVWSISTKPFTGAHFATFPESLIEPMVKAGCPKGGIVIDPFMGAGTTALVAIKQGRKFIGFELNEKYCNIARKRIAPYLEQQRLSLKMEDDNE